MDFFCRTACTDVTDKLTTFRPFHKPGSPIFTHSELKLQAVLTSTLSGDYDKQRSQQFIIIRALTRVFCISVLLSKKSRQQSHHHHYQCDRASFITEYHPQLLVLILPKL
jgi:hypothetical protein